MGRYSYLTLDSGDHLSGSRPDRTLLEPDLSYHVLTVGAALDWRTSPGYSTRGGLQRVSWSEFFTTNDEPFNFHQFEYEGVQLVPLVREQFGLAGRVLTTLADAGSGDEVPAILQPTLGGATTLRGFATRRFTDRNRLLFTGEYRWRPSRAVDMAIFFDAGKVGARRKDLGISHMRTDWGIGVRIHAPRFVILRLDVAKSGEGWQVVVAEGRVF